LWQKFPPARTPQCEQNMPPTPTANTKVARLPPPLHLVLAAHEPPSIQSYRAYDHGGFAVFPQEAISRAMVHARRNPAIEKTRGSRFRATPRLGGRPVRVGLRANWASLPIRRGASPAIGV